MKLTVHWQQLDWEGLLKALPVYLSPLVDPAQLIVVQKSGTCDYYRGEWTTPALLSQLQDAGACLFFQFAVGRPDGMAICADGRQRPDFGAVDLELLGFQISLNQGQLLIEAASFFLGQYPGLWPQIAPLSAAERTEAADCCKAMEHFIGGYIRRPPA